MNSRIKIGLAVSALSFMCCNSYAADNVKIVKIGRAAPTAGAIANLGKENENGALLAVEDVNRQGPVVGGQKVKLELVAMDDQADPQ